MRSIIEVGDIQTLDRIDSLLAEAILYLKMLDVQHVSLWKNDFLNENHNYLRMVGGQLDKIKNQIPSFSSKFRSKDSAFIDSLREITSVWSLNSMDADKLGKYIYQEIPDFVKHLKAVHPAANQASNILNRK